MDSPRYVFGILLFITLHRTLFTVVFTNSKKTNIRKSGKGDVGSISNLNKCIVSSWKYQFQVRGRFGLGGS